ncbi:MAG: 2-amino-4-hydroxy-6-hydroxymethyldihydropteridine diphosphokinase [Elusimicrobia bacterium]|nr:2-amino-4-hydroxy-6-hydroxymethyldihydropteridine diphosphokinase [Elusimicrobiota bacterium]
MTQTYLLLGGNVGRREKYLEKARRAIAGWPKSRLQRFSSIRETAPAGGVSKRFFLNQAAALLTDLKPMALLIWAKKTELELGRRRRERWGPREIDIDILLYGDQTIDHPFLQIPHPRLPERPFIKPLLAEAGL